MAQPTAIMDLERIKAHIDTLSYAIEKLKDYELNEEENEILDEIITRRNFYLKLLMNKDIQLKLSESEKLMTKTANLLLNYAERSRQLAYKIIDTLTRETAHIDIPAEDKEDTPDVPYVSKKTKALCNIDKPKPKPGPRPKLQAKKREPKTEGVEPIETPTPESRLKGPTIVKEKTTLCFK